MPRRARNTDVEDAVMDVGETLRLFRLELGLSQAQLAKVGRLHFERTGYRMGLSTKRVRKLEREEKETTRARLALGLVGAFVWMVREACEWLLGGTLPLVGLLYTDGYTPRNSLRTRNARVRLSLALLNLQTGFFSPGLTVVDLKKKWFKAYEHYTLQNQLEQLGGATCQAEPPSGQPCRLASVVVGKMCPDHLDRWSKIKGCGPTSHRCCTCAIPEDEWSLNIHNCPHLTVQQMADAGFPSRLASVAPRCRFVSPALHDTKGLVQKLNALIDRPTRLVLSSVCAHLRCDISQNAIGDQLRTVARAMGESRDLSGQWKWLYVCVTELIQYRYQDVPWRYHVLKEGAAVDPFLRARVAGHIFLVLMELVRRGSTKNAFCHSINHWWHFSDAIPLEASDEREEAENGKRKRLAPNVTSPQTYEVTMAMAEQRARTQACRWEKATLDAVGLEGKKRVIMCKCLSATAKNRLAVHRLLTQLTEIRPGFAHITGRYVLFSFLEGEGIGYVCLCSEKIPNFTFHSFVPDKAREELLLAEARQEWEGEGEDDEECEEEGEEIGGEEEEDEEEEDEESFSSDESDDEVLVECEFCGVDVREVGLSAHIDSHREKIICVCMRKCPMCPSKVKANGLAQHMEKKHLKHYNQPNRCRICWKKCASKVDFKTHIKTHKKK